MYIEQSLAIIIASSLLWNDNRGFASIRSKSTDVADTSTLCVFTWLSYFSLSFDNLKFKISPNQVHVSNYRILKWIWINTYIKSGLLIFQCDYVHWITGNVNNTENTDLLCTFYLKHSLDSKFNILELGQPCLCGDSAIHHILFRFIIVKKTLATSILC